MKPFAQSCEENHKPIREVIQPLLEQCETLLEIGSGTGQHAVYFCPQLRQLSWQTSDLAENHAGIHQWIVESELDNVLPPLQLDVSRQQDWPPGQFDAIYSANTLHIMPLEAVENFFQLAGECLYTGGKLIVYGPFNYNGEFTSDSNARFDLWLKQRNPLSGVRDFEKVLEFAEENGLSLKQDYPMPANNRILYWQKT